MFEELLRAGPLDAGWAALSAGDWERARGLFEEQVADGETPEALEGMGWAGQMLDEERLAFDARERAYRLYLERGDKGSSARIAAWLAADSLLFRGEPAVANGWLQRAHSLIDGLEAGADHGWLAIHEGHIALALDEDTVKARRLAARAVELGRRFGCPGARDARARARGPGAGERGRAGGGHAPPRRGDDGGARGRGAAPVLRRLGLLLPRLRLRTGAGLRAGGPVVRARRRVLRPARHLPAEHLQDALRQRAQLAGAVGGGGEPAQRRGRGTPGVAAADDRRRARAAGGAAAAAGPAGRGGGALRPQPRRTPSPCSGARRSLSTGASPRRPSSWPIAISGGSRTRTGSSAARARGRDQGARVPGRARARDRGAGPAPRDGGAGANAPAARSGVLRRKERWRRPAATTTTRGVRSRMRSTCSWRATPRFDAGCVRLDLAATLSASGRRDRAEREIEAALEGFRALGARRGRARGPRPCSESSGGRTLAYLPEAAGTPLACLSERELEVLSPGRRGSHESGHRAAPRPERAHRSTVTSRTSCASSGSPRAPRRPPSRLATGSHSGIWPSGRPPADGWFRRCRAVRCDLGSSSIVSESDARSTEDQCQARTGW